MDKIDYTDPQCPFCVDEYKDEPTIHAIDVRNAINKIDEFLAKNDYAGAERTLNFWIGEAKLGGDMRGLLSLKNEQMGMLRKLEGRGNEAMAAANEALDLVKKIGFEETVTAATTYVNAATVYKTYEQPGRAMELFEMALPIYERELSDGDIKLGSLYNNMGLALTDLDRFDEAKAAYEKALKVMEKAEYGKREQAITYLNIADMLFARDGMREAELDILECIDKAKNLLEDPELPHDGYHAFVLEKCAPSFAFYGFDGISRYFAQKADEIYSKQ